MGLIKAIFSFLAGLFRFMSDRQLIEAGKAEAFKDAVVAEQERVASVDAARSDPANIERLRERRFRD